MGKTHLAMHSLLILTPLNVEFYVLSALFSREYNFVTSCLLLWAKKKHSKRGGVHLKEGSFVWQRNLFSLRIDEIKKGGN